MIDLQFSLFNLQFPNLWLLLKILFLITIITYAAIVFFVYTKIRALGRVVFFPPRTMSNKIASITMIYFLYIVSLFLIALVIV